ncbi:MULTISPECIES: SDR family NAD(P)-dependent oxidoreductase [unclassified Moraxella]|uniref:SDR family NAD(P)-dependent oxidoreductase n=1 Tax=unclassified Moraxella TaxID=2685852 RepID=UPI003AF8395A
MNNHLIIIGGTSGIGLALANWHLSQQWQATVIGSNADKIANLPQSLLQNPLFTAITCDISDNIARGKLFDKLSQQPFNRLIYCAGKYYNERQQNLSQDESQRMLAVNLQAFQAVFSWASDRLQTVESSDKHLIAIASVAGLLDFAHASLYAKCKRAMIASCDAYRLGLQPFGIKVTCIASGYIDTQTLRSLNNGDASHKPHLISEEQAVTEIVHAIRQNIALHIFPKPMKRTISLLSMLPKPLLDKVMALQYRHQDSQAKSSEVKPK